MLLLNPICARRKLGLRIEECLHDVGIKMPAAALLDDVDGFGVGHGWLVNTARDQSVVNIGQGHEPGWQGDLWPVEPQGITVIVP